MKLYFARHGHTDASEQTIPNKTTGEVDEPLNSVGIQQADKLAEQLKDIQFDVIISSPLKRAYQTAEIVGKKHSLTIKVEDALREREIGGHVDSNVWNDLFDFDKNIVPKKGEVLKDFYDRVYTTIDSLKRKYNDKTILIISHGGVNLALYAYIKELPLSGNMRISPMKNCEYRIYEF
jgi:broad specificity phosphatase PhoE